MRKTIITLSVAAAFSFAALPASAQSAIDGYSLSRYQLIGTARYMSMGGAFTALGGDLTAITVNPAGLGLYRSSEVGATLGINIRSVGSNTQGLKTTVNHTNAACNNFGYVGSAYTGSDLFPYFNWSASYQRAASFDRRFRGNIGQLNGSLTNYIAGFTTADGWTSNLLLDNPNAANPYTNGYMTPWLSILAYNSYMINELPSASERPTDPEYVGLWQSGTSGHGTFDVVENGHVDEYNIDFGGNFTDIVYVGLGFGITDIEYKQNTYYTEDFTNASISNPQATDVMTGNGGYGLENWKRVSGTGFNFKLGVIIKPINELRIGLAVHTPTYYNLTSQTNAAVDFGYSSDVKYFDNSQYYETNDGYTLYTDWKLRTPWRLTAGIAGVIGTKGIISADYEYRPTQNIRMLDSQGTELSDFNGDCSNYFQTSSILRLGAEYRLTRNWSIRAGYSYESTPVKEAAQNGNEMIYTTGLSDTGTQPSYTFDNSTNYVTCGVGYRSKGFYFDAAYVHRHQSSVWHAYTPNNYTATAPSSELSANNNQIVLSIGVRF